MTPDAEGLGRAAQAVGGRTALMAASIGEAARWRVVLPREVPHAALVRALAEHAVPILAFEPTKADLEGAFWHLAATEPREAEVKMDKAA